MKVPGFISVRQGYVPPDRSSSGLNARVVSGTFWALGGTALGAAVQLASSMVFARLLSPGDFGVVAWADLLTQFILLFTAFGFNVSLVQQENLTRETLSTVWWSNMAIDLAAALVCVLVAIVTSRTMASPDVPRVIALMALQFFVISLGNANEALMLRQFMFRAIALNTLCGTVVSFAAALVLTGLLGYGLYGLVIGGIIGSTVMVVNRFLIVPWLPSMTFSWATCKSQLAFGSSLLGSTLAHYTNANLDRTGIGTALDKVQLGYFEYAGSVPKQIIQQLGTLLNRTLFPALATVHLDESLFRHMLLRYVRMTSLLLYPMLIGLSLVAAEFVAVFYGSQWTPTVTPMRLICVSGLISLVANSLVMVCNAMGRPQLSLKAALAMLPINAVCTFTLVTWGGLVGAAASRCLAPAVMVYFLWLWLGRLIRVSALDLFIAVMPAAAGCLAMTVVLWSTGYLWQSSSLGPLAILAVKIVLGAVTYCAVMWTGWRGEVETIMNLVRGAVGIRPPQAPVLTMEG